MPVINVSDKNFKAEIESSPLPVLADFYATWCGPCKALSPIIDDVAQEYSGKIKVVKVNTDESEELAQKFNITSVPTLIFFVNGNVVASNAGLISKSDLTRKIDGLLEKIQEGSN